MNGTAGTHTLVAVTHVENEDQESKIKIADSARSASLRAGSAAEAVLNEPCAV